MSILNFLSALKTAIAEYTDSITDQENKSVYERREDILKFELALMYYKLLIYYFRDTGISTDGNMMEQSEIQIVIDKINNIMDTNLYTDFS